MVIHQRRQKPEPWVIYRAARKAAWSRPFLALDWMLAWLAHGLSHWVLIEVLEYLGTFSILIGLIFYFAESGDRLKQKHYQAWQVINTAQGKGGSGGRIEALEELNADKVPLVGVDLKDAFLYGVQLNNADLLRSTFGSADLRSGSFESADLAYTNFDNANLRGVNLKRANLAHTSFDNADLAGADLSGAYIAEAHFDSADLRDTVLKGLHWRSVRSARLANLFGAKDVPPDFIEWAKHNGAVFISDTEEWNRLQAAADKSSGK